MTGGSSDDESNNPYLALRAAKIARNEARLRELGLLKTPPPPPTTATSAITTATAAASLPQSAKMKKVAAVKRKAVAPAADASNLRRSKRHTTIIVTTPTHHNEESSSSSKSYNAVGVDRRRGKGTTLQSEPVKKEAPLITPLLSTTPPSAGLAPNSARAIELNVVKLVLSNDGLLGRVMVKTGKAFVMEEAARLAAAAENYYIDNNITRPISFNKYSGIQEWANALFLWMNLGAPTCDNVINEFLQDGRQVTWFGGSRMHEKTRAIQRLMHEGQQMSSSSSSCIVLWCRRYQPTTKTFSPYTCMGRLSYHSHEPGSRPLAFCWNLIDYDRLVHHADHQVRQNFSSMIDLA